MSIKERQQIREEYERKMAYLQEKGRENGGD
ncbi:hypothetical protein JOD03_002553 [Chryseomicrobium aureum]|nr:hypothetical protein [Chryseomicrobium aureum]